VLVCIAQDGGIQDPMEAFHESIGCGVMSGCPGKVNAPEVHFTIGVRAPGTHWVRGWVDLRNGLDNVEK
jgi:hypothetical protein